MPFRFKRFDELPDIAIVEPKAVKDERGWFMETYKKSEFSTQGIPQDFLQDNHSCSTLKGVLRGLHFQKEPVAQGKLVRCIVGEVFDVAVDIRKGSPTYSRWVSVILSAQNRRMIWIPVGFAHGFLTTSDVSEVEYKVTAEYSNAHDRAIRWNDPDIGIGWPVGNPMLSRKDAEAPFLKEADNNFAWKKPPEALQDLDEPKGSRRSQVKRRAWKG
jgi:dTDP-4-dehydrorhamnose 3,5-epimerase